MLLSLGVVFLLSLLFLLPVEIYFIIFLLFKRLTLLLFFFFTERERERANRKKRGKDYVISFTN